MIPITWSDLSNANYPVHALPERARVAAIELADGIKTAVALPATCLLMAMSAWLQERAIAVLPSGKRSPLSLSSVICAESGSGKTPVAEAIYQALKLMDAKKAEGYGLALSQYQAEERLWSSESKALQAKLAKEISGGKDAQKTRQLILSHEAKKPKPPKLDQVVHRNVSEAALYESLEGIGVSRFIEDDEAGDLLGTSLFTSPQLLNSIWSGADSLPMNRGHKRHIEVRKPRVCVGLMVQPEVFDRYLRGKGQGALASGHFARYLVANVPSMAGFRFYDPDREAASWVHLPKFHERLAAIVAASEERSDSVEPTELAFSHDARDFWIRLQNATEFAMQPAGALHAIKNHASKAMDNVGRVAALFHLVDGAEGSISQMVVQRAWEVVRWHMGQYLQVFGPTGRTELQRDVVNLFNYLQRKWWYNGASFAVRRDVFKYGPIRDRKRFCDALEALRQQGAVWQNFEVTGRELVTLNGLYFNGQPWQ